MTKRLIILLAVTVMLCMAGCDSIGINVEDIQGSPSHQVAGEDNTIEAPAPQTTPTVEPSTQSTGPAYTEDDFAIAVDGITIAIGMDPAPVIAALGDGGADEDNNYGFIGWDESQQYKFFRHDYDGFAIIDKTEIASGTSIISQIAITAAETHRGISPGDTYDDMVAAYGEPDQEKSDEGMTDCTYLFGDRTIIFVLNDAGVIGYISIH
jgi:hypothetical protein